MNKQAERLVSRCFEKAYIERAWNIAILKPMLIHNIAEELRAERAKAIEEAGVIALKEPNCYDAGMEDIQQLMRENIAVSIRALKEGAR